MIPAQFLLCRFKRHKLRSVSDPKARTLQALAGCLVLSVLIIPSVAEEAMKVQDVNGGVEDARILLKFASEGGSGSSALQSWRLAESKMCANWVGVVCGEDGSVSELRLANAGLATTLPPIWTSLSGITTVQLSNNSIYGKIPSEWSALVTLRVLELDGNDLAGSIPAELSRLSGLRKLDLSFNDLSGVLPDTWPEGMLELQSISLGGNRLQGMLPEGWGTGKWTKGLEELSLGLNRLTGKLHASWSGLLMLHTLNVGHNCMTSSLPSSWSGMPLRSFKADGNPGLYGPLPTSWASLPLVELWLSETGVSGNLPQEWSTMTALQELQLSRTAVSGTLPAQWAFMSSLESIMLESAKSLSGELPPAWATMTALKNINLQHCNFTGTIPEAWGKLQSLQSMNASHNSLSGSIPSTWTLLTRLQSVDLSNNIMRGTVPSGFSGLGSLSTICLAENDMRCPIRDCGDAARVTIACRNSVAASNALQYSVIAGLALILLMGLIPTVAFIWAAHHVWICKDQSCIHRHPGIWHPWLTLAGFQRHNKNCRWCRWDGHTADLKTGSREMEASLFDAAIVGAGAYGTVYRAHWRGREVAVKVLHNMHDDNALHAFAKELEFGLKLQSCPSFCRLLGACLERPHVCVISEYLPGGSLRDRIHGQGKPRMTVVETLKIAMELAQALTFLHPEIVHRDLKPENIMLSENAQARIIDFGIGRFQSSPLLTSCTDGTDVAGTSAYMAPEALAGKVTAKGDIYALAIIINECLSGEEPFQEYSSPYQVQYAICIRDERPALANGCPSLLGQLLLRCWSKDWHKRPSANELCTIFRRLWHIEQGKYDNKVVADATDLATILKDLRLGDMPQTLEDTCIV